MSASDVLQSDTFNTLQHLTFQVTSDQIQLVSKIAEGGGLSGAQCTWSRTSLWKTSWSWLKYCGLFTEEEWRGFEYYIVRPINFSRRSRDGSSSYPGPGVLVQLWPWSTSASQGIGYVQEPVSRLTQIPITNFNSTVNDTILSFHQVRYVLTIHNLTFSCIYHCP